MTGSPFTEIHGVNVAFKHRDIRLVNDDEYRALEDLVDREKKASHGALEGILILTDYVGPHVRFVATTRHEETEQVPSPIQQSAED